MPFARESVSTEVEFKHITGVGPDLYGLDNEGGVWRYVPADYQAKPVQYAYWARLTSRGRDATTHPARRYGHART